MKIHFQASRVTSDGGLILVRDWDDRLGLEELTERHLTDPRRAKNTQFRLADLLRQSAYSRLAGSEDVNDVQRLSQDPTVRLLGSEKISRAWCGPEFAVRVLRERDDPDDPRGSQAAVDAHLKQGGCLAKSSDVVGQPRSCP